ncbi:hypothetical protein QN277_026999 [Acacia crassicarpa]|uniref:Uncharacterized protein n=1 Tax=Acacia crassicarpa TaxID=499986 RepID=A0AAE1JDB9_9FABA|nr:hypothetical protein QN277_026999 [Acacia crassicarpa]
MLGLAEPQSVLLWDSSPIPLKPPATMAASFAPVVIPRRRSMTSASATSLEVTSKLETSKSISPPSSSESFVSATPPIRGVKNLGFRPTPELGLLSLFFPLSMAFGAFFSVALVSVPTIIAFGRLGASMKKLSKVASEEVPGTLSSLKLSSMELNDLTQKLRNLSDMISGIRPVKDRDTKDARSLGNEDPVS